MPDNKWLFLFVLLLLTTPTLAVADVAAPQVLIAFGPGGPHRVLQECAELFEETHGVPVKVFKSKPESLAQKLEEHGDIYYGGAEYMLEDFVRRHPDVLDPTSAVELYPRRIGVMVRTGNPLNITGHEDLARSGVNLLAVELEQMEQFHPPDSDEKNIIHREVYTGQEGVAAWRTTPEIDAWVTYKSWHVTLGDEADFIEIPGDDALRHTPVALTRRTANRHAALHFIDFLQSPAARQIFAQHGWD